MKKITDQELQQLVAQVAADFNTLSAHCPHREGVDCAHPAIEFNSMLCAPCNCPLLLEKS